MSDNRDKAQEFLEWTGIGYSNRTWDGLTKLLDEKDKQAEENLDELKQAIEFFDKVKDAYSEARIAVGSDHWDWLESAARKVVKKGDE